MSLKRIVENFLQHCLLRLNVLYDYFDSPKKLFSDLYLAKFRYFSKSILSV